MLKLITAKLPRVDLEVKEVAIKISSQDCDRTQDSGPPSPDLDTSDTDSVYFTQLFV